MSQSVYEIELFWSLFSTNKQLIAFLYDDFVILSLKKLKQLPNQSTFIALSTEWRVIDGKIVKIW